MKNNLNQFSSKFSVMVGIMLLMFTNCSENMLEEAPLDFLSPKNSYTTVTGIRQGISGLHLDIRRSWYYNNKDEVTSIIMLGMGTDEGFYGEDPGNNVWGISDFETFFTPVNNHVSNFWTWNYKLIQMANVLIEGINNSDNSIWKNEAQKNAYSAEAKFFRAYAYRILTSFYGDVPLVSEVTKQAKTDYEKVPKEEVFQLMEEDLKYAAEYLPVPGEEEAPGRITQGAAWHYLSELYLTEDKYELAVEAASKVINGYNYSLMTTRFGSQNDILGSGDVYYDLFSFGNQNLAENAEAIWVIQCEPPMKGGGSMAGERNFGCAYWRIGTTPDGYKAFRGEFVDGKYTGYSDTLGRPIGYLCPTNYMKYLIWKNNWNKDIRNAEHNIKRNFFYDNPESQYHKKRIDFSLYPQGTRDPIRDTCQYIFPYWMKFADPCHHFTDPARSGAGNHHKDVYALRLAETLLLRAEAYVEMSSPDLAAVDINEIRNRSNATPVSPDEVNMDYILDERARELYGEEWRHITLRRMNKFVERVQLYNNNPKKPGLNVKDFHKLLPIPQSQIDLNVDLKIQQNTGY